MAAAAAVALLIVGGSGGWLLRGLPSVAGEPVDPIAISGLEAHRLFVAEKRHAVEVAQTDESHLVTWLSRRLDRTLEAPDLSHFGLALLGGRLLPQCGGEPAAQLMYEDATGARFTLYVTRGHGEETAFRILDRDGISAAYWIDKDLSYAWVGSAPRERMLEICREIYAQLARDLT